MESQGNKIEFYREELKSAETADIRIRIHTAHVTEDELVVALMDGRTISAPLAWFPRLFNAEPAQRAAFEIAGGGYGLHWPALDEDISTEGLLRGARGGAA